MQEMTSRQRLLAAYKHQPVDRIPCSPRVSAWMREYYGAADYKTVLRMADEFGFDAHTNVSVFSHPVGLTPSVNFSLPGVEATAVEEEMDGDLRVVRRIFKTPEGELTDVTKTPPPGDKTYGVSPNPVRTEYLVKEPRDLKALGETLALMPALRERLEELDEPGLRELGGRIRDLESLRDELQAALVDEPPATLVDGGVIRDGYDPELDRLRSLSSEGRDWILRQQESEREKTGIGNLKIGYNRVFGYYIEVSKGQLDKVPEHYMAKQTLTGSQRYVTPELKSREEEILRAWGVRHDRAT